MKAPLATAIREAPISLNWRRKPERARPSREERGARYFATDICDGMAQGHDGINYSLASREIISQAD